MNQDTPPPHRISLALSAAGMGVWEWDIARDVLRLDDQLISLYGLRQEDLRGTIEDWRSILHPDTREWTLGELARIMGQSDEFSSRYQILRPVDGKEGWLGSAGRVIRDNSGQPMRMIGISWDNSGQVKMEKEVSRAYDFIEGIINSISDPIFVKDRDHRWVFFNNAFVEMVGTQREQLLGKTDHEFYPKEMADHFWRVDDDVFRTGREI